MYSFNHYSSSCVCYAFIVWLTELNKSSLYFSDVHMSDTYFEPCINLKYLLKLKKVATKSYRLLGEVYGESAVSKDEFKWHDFQKEEKLSKMIFDWVSQQ
jgi:hypothetical protein